MKTMVLLIAASGLLSTAYSQDIHWGVQGGLNLSGGIARETGVIIHGDIGVGYALGVVADMPLNNPLWSIRSSLSFQHETSNADIFDDNTFIRVNYFNLPVDLVYHPAIADKRWVFGAGPWFAYGLSGKYTQQGYTYAVDFGSAQTNDAHRLDFGLDLMAGYELKPDMMLTAKLDWGLIDVSAQPDFVTIHTRSFGVNFVYWFPGTVNLPKKK